LNNKFAHWVANNESSLKNIWLAPKMLAQLKSWQCSIGDMELMIWQCGVGNLAILG